MTDRGLTVQSMTCAAGTRTLFQDLDLDLPAGQWTMLTGPNGSGKTTLLRAIAGLVRPVEGRLRWNGEAVSHADPRWRAQLVYIGHGAGAKSELTTRENLALQLGLDLPQGVPADRIDQALDDVGLGRQRSLPFGRLSAGQRRRWGLARLRCIDRPLWLLDEPTTALDAQALSLLCEMLDAHLDQGGCALVATHQALAMRHAPASLEIAQWRPRRSRAPGVEACA